MRVCSHKPTYTLRACSYTRFDNLCLKSGNSVYKVETIGDSYMLATGLLASDPHHALTALQFAFAMRREAAKVGTCTVHV